MLTLNNISIERDDQKLIDNFSLTLFPSACLNIYGSNGCGKTSLLTYISSLSNISPKTIFYNKIDVTKAIDEYRWLTSYVGHKNSLTSELSVNENIKFWASISNREETIEAALTCFDLIEIRDKKISELSAGLCRRVALARLLVSNSIVWLLDEPFANLDKNTRELFCNVIKAKCQQGGIVMITSHAPLDDFSMMHLNIEEFANE